MDTTDGELETCLRGSGLGLARGVTGGLAGLGLSADFSRHDYEMIWVVVMMVVGVAVEREGGEEQG